MDSLNHNLRLSAATVLALCLGSYWYSATADAAEVRDITKINGGIRVNADERVGNVTSVNGSIDLRQGASADAIETVNGGIDIDDEVTITQAETVNGGIRVGRDVTVRGSLHTVNGGIRIEQGSVIERSVKTVNGKIQLRNTRIGEDLQTSNGDIELRDGSVVEGDLIVRGRRSWFDRFFSFNDRLSEITIDSSSSVQGDIHLYRKADLRIADGAVIGDIIEHF